MANERKWGKSGPEQPAGDGGMGSGEPARGEAEGRSRLAMATCATCGAQSYIGPEWKWFTCWKCGAISQETALA
jgi:hypothetical protein